jgi:alpha-L-rhamnosidase
VIRRISRGAPALAVLLALGAAAARPATASESVGVTALRAADLTDPLGIDDTTPPLSWQITATGRDVTQTAYEIQAATAPDRLGKGRPDLWDTGRVASAAQRVDYKGHRVGSRTQVYWRVRVWTHNGSSPWSAPATWSTGLLSPGDWSAKWIGNPDWETSQNTPHPMTIKLSKAQDARYVRLDVTHLEGSTVDPSSADLKLRLELAEMAVVDGTAPGTDLARGAAVTASESDDAAGEWRPEYLTDGSVSSRRAPYGYRSAEHPTRDVSAHPITLTLDLGQVRHFDQILLYPRDDTTTQFASTVNWPRDLAIDTGTGADALTRVTSLTYQNPPTALHDQPAALPLFARDFTVNRRVSAARLYITGVGVYDATLNGRPVSAAVLEPPNTDVHHRLVASTYDVTSLLRQGGNRIGAALGTGTFDVNKTPDDTKRYQKFDAQNGPPRLMAQLEIRYADGSRQTVATDGSWRTTLGPTTFSNWYGGEDYDARRAQAGWDTPGTALTGWDAARVTGTPVPGARVEGRTAPPIEPVQTLKPIAITEPQPGTYVFDFGVNAAGWPQLRADGPAGTRIQMWPAEKLKSDGTITQATFIGPVHDTLTLDGKGPQVWHPRFMYHGFRYLQVTGLTSKPVADDARSIVLRTVNDAVGSFSSSNDLVNKIHGIIDRAIQSNMYSVLTDCPHREKLGWLEQDNLVFGSVAAGYDVEAYYRKILQDVADAQLPDGMVPDVAPEYAEYSEWDTGYRDDANWGGTLIRAPWLMYRTYGDTETMRRYYPNMRRYLDYLTSRSSGGLLPTGLGDWIALDTTTPREYVGSIAYAQLAGNLADIATVLGEKSDAQRYRALADRVGAAINAKYLDADAHTYATGSQAADALALQIGIVPRDQHAAVLAHLIASIRAKDDHLTVGEIGLPAVIDVLSAAGRDDVVYDLASQTTAPSYGAQVLSGSTSLGEAWDGMAGDSSQNHFMLGAIDAWFTGHLAGIQQTADSIGYRHLRIAPAAVGDLTHAAGAYRTPYGQVRTDWTKKGDHVDLTVTVPPGSTAEVHVPGSDQVHNVGSGTWTFHS